MDTTDQNPTLNDSFDSESSSESSETTETDTQQFFICGICTHVYNEPVTLLCQHTFCRPCLLEMTRSKHSDSSEELFVSPGPVLLNGYCNGRNRQSKCPLCNLPFVIPPKAINFAINDYIESSLTGEQRDERKKDALKKSLEEEVRTELKEELYNTVVKQLDAEGKLLSNKVQFESMSPGLGMYKDPNIYGNEKCFCFCKDCYPMNPMPMKCIKPKNGVFEKLKGYLPQTFIELSTVAIVGLLGVLVFQTYRRKP